MSTPVPISNAPLRLPSELGLPSVSADAQVPAVKSESRSGQTETNAAGTTSSSLQHKAIALISGGTAISYYLSALLHLMGYGSAAGLFYILGISFLPEEEWINQPLRASLEDQDVLDEDARLEFVPEINMGTEQQTSSVEQLARQLRIVDAGWIDTLQTDALTAVASADASPTDGTAGNGFFFQVPKSGLAVTKGSFTAWAEPNSPRPGQNYLIIIEIRLPDDIERYRVTDLVGEVEGTDTYKQRIPYDSRARSATAASTPEGLKVINSSTVLDVKNNKVQLAVRVPGAARMVRDTITIRSRKLKERQQLVLVFGNEPAEDEDDN